MIRGSLTIHLRDAELTRDVKKFGKMNVFVTFEHKTSTHKSSICESEGKEPSWENSHFDFLVKQIPVNDCYVHFPPRRLQR